MNNKLRNFNGEIDNNVQEERKQIDKRIMVNTLNDFGISMKNLGYKYTITALELLGEMKEREAMSIEMGIICNEVARIHNTNYDNVRRTIETLIKIAMTICLETGEFHNVLGKNFKSGNKPTAFEFLRALYEYIRIERYEEQLKKAQKSKEYLEHLRLEIIVYNVLKNLGFPTCNVGYLYIKKLVVVLIEKKIKNWNLNSYYIYLQKSYKHSKWQVKKDFEKNVMMAFKLKEDEMLNNVYRIKEKNSLEIEKFIKSIVKYITNKFL